MTEFDAFACPRCDRTPLERTGAGLCCGGCKVDFPDVGGIAWLFAEPAAALGEWRGRLHFALESLERERQAGLNALDDRSLGRSTRQRLEASTAALEDHAARLRALSSPFDVDGLTAGHETYLALRTRLPPDQGLMTYYGNVHRDWCWGDAENDASFELVRDLLGRGEPGRTLVLGAGAGRLAYDWHQRTASATTIALDFNPLLTLLAHRISNGDSVELYEFPLAPKSLEQRSVLRTLRAPEPARGGLMHCVADAQRPPFAAQAFDTVLTPWLVDILPESFAILARRINRLLDAGGRWINFGSLSFHHADPALQLSPEECIEAIEAAGFHPPRTQDVEMPYLCSPASRHGRRESVLGWAAAKRVHAKKVERHESLPDWIVRGKQPVPLLDHFRAQAIATRIHAFIMSLIDGRRSIADMAAVLEEQGLMSRAEAEPAIRGFLIRMYEESRRRGRY